MSLRDSSKDYYAVLGARPGASPREIEKLYKQLARKKHPDRGGTEEEMKGLNEAYRVLHDETSRREYDEQSREPRQRTPTIKVTPASREVGIYGQSLSAMLCFALGFMLLLLVRFNGLWFLWPLSILAMGVILFGVVIAHSAMTNARNSLAATNPAKRFRLAQEIAFWVVVACGGVAFYLIMTSI